MKLVRSALYLLWTYGSMAVIGLGFMPLAALYRPAAMWAEKLWCRCAVAGLEFLCGVRVEVKGLEQAPRGPALIAGKHQAQLDTMMPFLLFDNPAMVLKQELLRMPVFGWYAQRSKHVSIKREANAAALRVLLKGAQAAKAEGRQIVIFPEGTRVRPGERVGYKPGVAALYRALDLPCVPLALNTGLCWPARGWIMNPGTVTLHFLAPIQPGLDREAFMAELERRIETASEALLAPAAAAPS